MVCNLGRSFVRFAPAGLGALASVAAGQGGFQPPVLQLTPPSNRISELQRVGDAVMFDADGPGPLPARLTVVGGLGGPYSASNAVAGPPHYVKQFDGTLWNELPSTSDFVAQSWMCAVMDPDGAGPIPETLVTFGTFCEPGVLAGWSDYRRVVWSGLAAYVAGEWVRVPGSEKDVMTNAAAIRNASFPSGTASVERLPSRAVVIDFDAEGPEPPALACLADFVEDGKGIYIWDTQNWRRIAGITATSFNHDVVGLTLHDPDGEGSIKPVLISTRGTLIDSPVPGTTQTFAGASKFDGVQWKHVSTDDVPVAAVASLAIDPARPEKRTLVAIALPATSSGDTNGRLVALEQGTWRTLRSNAGSSRANDALIMADPDGDGPRGVMLLLVNEFLTFGFVPPVGGSGPWNGISIGTNGIGSTKARVHAVDFDGAGPVPPAAVVTAFDPRGGSIAGGSRPGVFAFRWTGSGMNYLGNQPERAPSLGASDPDGTGPLTSRLTRYERRDSTGTSRATVYDGQSFVPYTGGSPFTLLTALGVGASSTSYSQPPQLRSPIATRFTFDADGPGPRNADHYYWAASQTTSSSSLAPPLTQDPELWRWTGATWQRIDLPRLRPDSALIFTQNSFVSSTLRVAAIDSSTGLIATPSTARPTLALAGDFDFAGSQRTGNLIFYTPGTRRVDIISQVPETATATARQRFTLPISASSETPYTARWVSTPPLPEDATTTSTALVVPSMPAGTYHLTLELTPSPVIEGAPSETVSSITVVVTVPPCGIADIAGANQTAGRDDRLTADDVIVYIGRYFAPVGSAQRTLADIAGPNLSPGSDGQVNADDLVYFLSEFFAGCQ